MKDKKSFSLLLAITLAGGALVSSAMTNGRGRGDHTTTQEAEDSEHAPVVEYGAPPEADPAERVSRAAKDKRHSTGVKDFIKDRETRDSSVLTISHWSEALPALPAGRSALVVSGEVVGARAYLSGDGTGVYSEFAVSVAEVFKSDDTTAVLPGALIIAERRGGRVRFPSGRVIRYGVRGQGVPRRARRYVLFLGRNEQQYSILTAYELRAGRVHPLDGKNATGGDEWAGDVYEGADETRFLSEVRRAAAQSSRPAAEQGSGRP